MERWLGDSGMALIGSLGGNFDAYGEGWVTAAWVPTELSANPHGVVHAGSHAVMLDAAMNFVVNAALEGKDRTRGTLEMKIDYVSGAQPGDTLVVRGELTRLTKQVAFAEAAIRNDKDQLVSRATGTLLVHREPPAPAGA